MLCGVFMMLVRTRLVMRVALMISSVWITVLHIHLLRRHGSSQVYSYSVLKEQCSGQSSGCSRRVLQRNKAPRWIAIWLPSAPEADVSHMTRIPGWKTVVVGDGFCPRGCRYSIQVSRSCHQHMRFPDCVFLDPASQAILGSSLAPLLPPNDPAKKNLAYLYAIKQRAHFIYDTNVNIRPLHNLSDFFYGNTSGLVYTGKGIFNYYKHYGEHWFYPPGFVDMGFKKSDPSDYVLSDISTPEVQYGLWKVQDKSGPRFQSVVPAVFLGSQSSAPFDSRNTMFSKRAFWGLFILRSLHGDIFRSYFLQTLLKYISGHVGFLHPNAEQINSAHSAMIDLNPVSKNSVSFLLQWNCRNKINLRTCFSSLISDLLAENMITKLCSLKMNTWLFDLMLFNYYVSDIPINESPVLTRRTNKLHEGALQTTPVGFSPTPGVYFSDNPDSHTYNLVAKICENFTYPSQVPFQFDDILLIVTFNYAFLYTNIYYIEAIYRRYFPHILFCGPDFGRFRDVMTSLPVNLSVAYVTGIERRWLYFQECTVYAMKMHFSVKGYLQIGDDTLLNPWSLIQLSRERIWTLYPTKSLSKFRVTTDWMWWPGSHGKKALIKTFTDIKAAADMSKDSKEKRFYDQYVKNVKSFDIFFNNPSDVFYIPDRLKEEFIYFTGLFFKSTLLVEAALPTMTLGLDDEENIIHVNGSVLYEESQITPFEKFNTHHHFLHPLKIGLLLNNTKFREFMCATYLLTMVNQMNVSQMPHEKMDFK